MPKLRVTVDTNVLVSGIISEHGSPFFLLEYWKVGKFELITSLELIWEFENVLQRAKILKYPIAGDQSTKIIRLLRNEAKLCLPAPFLSVDIRDSKDTIVVATALGGKADYLVTGDKDLLVLRDNPRLKSLKIVTVDEFLKMIA